MSFVLDVTDTYLKIYDKNGEELFITRDLMKKLNAESDTWHWTPWLRTRTEIYDNVVKEVDCAEASSVDSFPDSIFTGLLFYLFIILLYTAIRNDARLYCFFLY